MCLLSGAIDFETVLQISTPKFLPLGPECHVYAVFWTILVGHFLSLLEVKIKFSEFCTKF